MLEAPRYAKERKKKRKKGKRKEIESKRDYMLDLNNK
jgi:hypothetical protein